MKTFYFALLICASLCTDEIKQETTDENEVLTEDTLLGQGMPAQVQGFQPAPQPQGLSIANSMFTSQRNNLFNVRKNSPYHPAKILIASGLGIKDLNNHNSAVRVIYFAEKIANPQMSRFYTHPPRHFIIVYALNNNGEKFIGIEAHWVYDTVKGKYELKINEAIHVVNLNHVRKIFSINYFPPQLLNSYKTLLKIIRRNKRFKAISRALRVSQQQNFVPIKNPNISDPVHPINALGLALYNVPNMVMSMNQVHVLNMSQSGAKFYYLLKIRTNDNRLLYIGLIVTRNQYNPVFESMVIDSKLSNVEDFLGIKNLGKKFMNYYNNIYSQVMGTSGVGFYKQFGGN